MILEETGKKFREINSLAELMTIATDDMAALFNNDSYDFESDQWHDQDDDGVCFVCAAGAVMANTLMADPSKQMAPSNFDTEVAKRLLAIDDARKGYISTAYGTIGQFCLGAYDIDIPCHNFHSAHKAMKFIEFWRLEGIPILKEMEADNTETY